MGFSQRLELRQSQALVMTPQLQQAIKMLQLSNLELTDFVDAEIQQNPLLERREPTAEEASPAAAPAVAEEIVPAALPETLQNDFAPDAAEHWHAASGAEGDGSVDFGGEPQAWHSRNGALGSEDRPGFEQTAARPRTLREHVIEQIGTDLVEQGDQLIALHLLDLLDETGYLRGALDGVALLLGCELARVEAVLARLQQFDPAGVFARDLPECLALQLRDRNRLDPAMQALLDNLPLLATRNIAGADARVPGRCRRRGRDDRGDQIPRPAPRPRLRPAAGAAGRAGHPDAGAPRGRLDRRAQRDTLPRVLVNNKYHAQISRAARNKAEKDYLTDRLQAANWLVKSLHQRATTILKVAAEIVRQQDGFFRRGVQSLRPLILRDIAEAIGMHESTVSRVTSNKHMATAARGL